MIVTWKHKNSDGVPTVRLTGTVVQMEYVGPHWSFLVLTDEGEFKAVSNVDVVPGDFEPMVSQKKYDEHDARCFELAKTVDDLTEQNDVLNAEITSLMPKPSEATVQVFRDALAVVEDALELEADCKVSSEGLSDYRTEDGTIRTEAAPAKPKERRSLLAKKSK